MELTDERYAGIAKMDSALDGQFFVCVKSTGIFCWPSCRSRTPKRENILLVQTAQQALDAGFRPCKRCKPLDEKVPAAQWVEQVTAYLQANLARKITLQDIAQSCHGSPFHLQRIFTDYMGLSPHGYLMHLRMEKAKELLRTTDLAVQDIAPRVGFENIPYFVRVFGEKQCQSPYQYRKGAPAPERKNTVKKIYFYDTEFGKIGFGTVDDAITNLYYGEKEAPQGEVVEETPLHQKAAAQLGEYFSGQRKTFDLPLAPQGTEFQKKVWQALLEIPYGEVRTYKDIAQAVGSPKGYRAVGLANNRNHIAILIPCHRVVGSDGNLVGFAYGLDVKQRLLDLEQRHGQ